MFSASQPSTLNQRALFARQRARAEGAPMLLSRAEMDYSPLSCLNDADNLGVFVGAIRLADGA